MDDIIAVEFVLICITVSLLLYNIISPPSILGLRPHWLYYNYNIILRHDLCFNLELTLSCISENLSIVLYFGYIRPWLNLDLWFTSFNLGVNRGSISKSQKLQLINHYYSSVFSVVVSLFWAPQGYSLGRILIFVILLLI